MRRPIRQVIASVAGLALACGFLSASPASADDVLTPALQDLAAGQSEEPPSGSGLIPTQEIITRPNGRVLVNVRLADTDPSTLTRLAEAGARVRVVNEALKMATVAIDPSDLDRLTPLVESAQEVLEPMANAACPTGPFVSEGVTQLKAAIARTDFQVTGRDVTVGVLSDSYNRLGGAATDVANGELPGSNNPCGNTDPVGNILEGPSGIDEGRAMAQIVHDVAPGARIIFASAFVSDLQFAQSIRDLADQGADIIVDDITYYNEAFYQDGVIAKAVADVTAAGVVYFSSAANSNLILGGNRVASYEAPAFRSTTCPAAIVTFYNPTPVTCHDFNPTATVDPTYGITGSGTLRYTLGWNQPQFGVTTDLDICLTNATGTTSLGCITNNNLTTQTATEVASGNINGSVAWVVVRKTTGLPRFKLISHRTPLTAVEYPTSSGGDIVGPTIFGHNASIPGVTVAAVPFNNAGVLETFSSWGPARYCWGPVTGNTPAAALVPCQTATVDLAATDGTQNSFFGGGTPNRFYGTSAAAPHAAAVAALMLDKEQCLSPAQVIANLQSSGRAVGATPVDGAGAGLIDAQTALTTASAANCDTAAPRVSLDLAGGWSRTPSVSGTVGATDRRVVTGLACTGATVNSSTGIGTTQANGTVVVSGEGQHAVSCQGSDAEGNTGAGPGSSASAMVGIDTGAPTLTCRPLSLTAGQTGTLIADVSDGVSGPAAASVSVAVTPTSPGTFSATLTGSDVAGNSASTSCSYTAIAAVRPAVTGPSKVKVGKRARFTATGFPASSAVKWQLIRKGKKVAKLSGRTNAAGVSSVRVRFAKKGNFVLRAKAGAVTASKKVKARR